MLKWKTTKKKKRAQHQAEAEVGDDASLLLTTLTEFWAKLLDELNSQPDGYAWDFLVVEIITQCGTINGFTMQRGEEYGQSSSFSVSLGVDIWYDRYDDLPDPEENEAKFEKAYDRLHKSQMSSLKKALGDPAVKKRFAALKKRDAFAVFCVDEGETPVRDRLEFLWGNRPARKDFSDGKELFEYIFNKAETYPEYSMKFKGKKLFAVHWFGHEFTNKYVNLLEDVPNVQQLCSDLKHFILSATRVDSKGVERIKKALPKVKVTVVSDDDWENDNDPWDKL